MERDVTHIYKSADPSGVERVRLPPILSAFLNELHISLFTWPASLPAVLPACLPFLAAWPSCLPGLPACV